jgi:hypothetical protein
VTERRQAKSSITAKEASKIVDHTRTLPLGFGRHDTCNAVCAHDGRGATAGGGRHHRQLRAERLAFGWWLRDGTGEQFPAEPAQDPRGGGTLSRVVRTVAARQRHADAQWRSRASAGYSGGITGSSGHGAPAPRAAFAIAPSTFRLLPPADSCTMKMFPAGEAEIHAKRERRGLVQEQELS